MKNIIFVAFLLATQPIVTQAFLAETIGVVAGVGAAVFAVPAALGAVGFGSTIAAGSAAAKLMSIAATTGYGGAIVGGLQSVGAGVGLAGAAVGGLSGAGIAHSAKHLQQDREDD